MAARLEVTFVLIQNSLLLFVNQVILMLTSWYLNEKAESVSKQGQLQPRLHSRPTVNILVVYSGGRLSSDDNDFEDGAWENLYFNFEFRCYLDLFSTRSDLNPYPN